MVKLNLRFFQSFCKGFAALALLCSTSFANAVIIESEVSSLGGTEFQYDFNVINNDLVAGVEGFSVYFDYTLFEIIDVVASPVDWDSFVADFGLLPEDDFFDSFFLVDPIALGDSLDGFSVSVNYLGTASAPEAAGNLFEVYDGNFAILEAGVTTEKVVIPPPNPNPIPEPGMLSIFGLALLFAGMRKRIIK